MLKQSTLAVAALASTTLSVLPGSAATFVVDKTFWGNTTTTGSFAWAMHQAEITPGYDLINLTTNVNIGDYQSSPLPFRLANITDPAGLLIQGNGHSLTGDPAFISQAGVVHTKINPRKYDAAFDNLVGSTYSFARVFDNVADVTVLDLTVDGLNQFMTIGKGSTVTVQDSIFKNMGYFGINSGGLFAVNDATLNLARVSLHRINTFETPPFPGEEFLWAPAIAGVNSTLNVEKSIFDLFSSSIAGGISWNGGTANVVSSQILGQGLSIADNVKEGVLNVVNSVIRPYSDSATARIQAFRGGLANVIASTIQYDASGTTDATGKPFGCPASYKCNGAPLQVFSDGKINLVSSAVSAINTDIAQIAQPYSASYDGKAGTFNADELSFVQPVPNQDSAALKSLFGQPNLLTSGVPYALDSSFVPDGFPPVYFKLRAGASPLDPGPLLNVVADADGSNQLLNPINGSVILEDVFGNPRTFQGRRDIGAVQATQAPAPLPLLGFGAAMGWSRRLRQRVRASR